MAVVGFLGMLVIVIEKILELFFILAVLQNGINHQQNGDDNYNGNDNPVHDF